MLSIFTNFADWSIGLMGLSLDSSLGSAVHFFIEDVFKIFFLIYISIFIISLFRAQISPDKIKHYLSGRGKWYGYMLAVFLGVFTPFCSCSSIPLFIGFVSAGIPFGIAMAFLISSPLISEIATFMLMGMEGAGVFVAFVYVLVGTVISIMAGYLTDKFKLERFLDIKIVPSHTHCHCESKTDKFIALLKYANEFALSTLKSIYLYVILGLVVGAVMHGYVPQELFIKYLGRENVFAVPFAAVAGIPVYANHTAVVPIIQVLLLKGVPVGTSLVMLMSITAISLPEMIMLKKVFSFKLLTLFILFLFVAFMLSGYVLNCCV